MDRWCYCCEIISYPQKGFAAFYGSDHHEAEKGSIKIIKKGEAFTGTEKVQAGEYELTVPVYSEYTLKDIEFTLTAKEDIYYDFDLLYKKGTVIASQKTDENGVIEFKDLGYGLYELKENAVEGNNYIEVTDPVEVKITYNSDNNTIEKIDKEFNNEYQKVRVGGMKSFEYVNPNLNIDLNNEMKQVLVGLYAAEDIRGQNDALLKKDTLIALAVPDSDGFFEFNCDLPSGNYYVRELKGSSNFSLDTNIHNVEAICDENEPKTKKYSDNIVNKTGIIEGIKKDANGKTLANAVIGLFEDPDCTIEIDRKTTGEDGNFKFTDLPLNTYYVKEIEAPEGYTLNIKVFEVKAVEKDAEPIYISIINDEKPTPTPTTTTTTTTTTESSEETVTETENYEALVITTETTETSETTLVTEITETTQSPKKAESKTQTKTITETGEEGSIIKTIGLSILYVAIIISVIGLGFGFIRMKKR
ncbi:MAG: hypothetical protein J6U54_00565 [Clostridiales bacterium]|nr:hypothetical protein [Clostridiales bacterium]